MSKFAKQVAALDRALAANPSLPSGLSYWLVRFTNADGQIGAARRVVAESAAQARRKFDHLYGGYVSNDPSFRVVVERDRGGARPAAGNPAAWKKSPWGESLIGWGCSAEIATPPPYIAGAWWKWRIDQNGQVVASGLAKSKREARRDALAAMKKHDRA